MVQRSGFTFVFPSSFTLAFLLYFSIHYWPTDLFQPTWGGIKNHCFRKDNEKRVSFWSFLRFIWWSFKVILFVEHKQEKGETRLFGFFSGEKDMFS